MAGNLQPPLANSQFPTRRVHSRSQLPISSSLFAPPNPNAHAPTAGCLIPRHPTSSRRRGNLEVESSSRTPTPKFRRPTLTRRAIRGVALRSVVVSCPPPSGIDGWGYGGSGGGAGAAVRGGGSFLFVVGPREASPLLETAHHGTHLCGVRPVRPACRRRRESRTARRGAGIRARGMRGSGFVCLLRGRGGWRRRTDAP